MERIAYEISEAAKASGVHLRFLEAAIQEGSLKAHHIGMRDIILAEELVRWLLSNPLSNGKATDG